MSLQHTSSRAESALLDQPGTDVPSGQAPAPHRQPLSRGLIALNVALILGLGLAIGVPSALAGRQPTRARGQYTMLNGLIQGGNSDAIYVVDSANQEMIVLRWNDSRATLEGLGYRSLTADASAQPGR